MKLTEHFTLEEFVRDQNLTWGSSILPLSTIAERLRWLCVFILEPIRIHLKCPLVVTSGFRTVEHNKTIGGAATSYHLFLEDHAAVDFQVPAGPPLADIFDWIRLESHLRFDAAILERGEQEGMEYDDCLHIQLNASPRRIAKAGKTHGRGEYEVMEVR